MDSEKSFIPAISIPNEEPDRYRTIDIAHLHLNPLNPRHHAITDEPAIIRALYDKEAVDALALDIAKRGQLSPLEIIGVTPIIGNPGHFLALEGNRRTCALILLTDPSRAPTSGIRSHLEKVAAEGVVPQQIKVYEFADQTAADQWIDMRHMGEQGGVGTRKWDSIQQARALEKRNSENRPASTAAQSNLLALAVLNRLTDHGYITSEQRELINITTITRYLGTPAVRTILGLGDREKLIYTHDPVEVDAGLAKLVLDSLPAAN